MKFFHLSDLHLGKVLSHFSLLEDQKYILKKIIEAAREHKPDAVLIAGDLYDSATPSTEAVKLCDEFLTALVRLPCKVLLISGNHDSPERLSFLSSLVQEQGVYISATDLCSIKQVPCEDEFGRINFYLLPFVRPSQVRNCYPDLQIETYTDALRVIIEHLPLNTVERNVLLTHQFVTGALRSDSELSVGGTDNVDAEVFKPFDYVALGHLHSPQSVGSQALRYCGSPLKYSFSEVLQHKSLSCVTLKDKGNLSLQELPLVPLHELSEVKGSFEELCTLASEHQLESKSYYRFMLTDEQEIPEALSRLRYFYPNLMQLYYTRVAELNLPDSADEEKLKVKSPYEQLEDFFRLQQHKELSDEQQQLCQELMHRIWEED